MSLCLMTLSFVTRIHVFMPNSTHIATGVLAFIPDSTTPFHRETSYLCLIASPWPGWKFRWCCHRNPLFIPDRTFWKSVNFQPSKTLKSRGKSMVFSTHSSGLTLTDTFGAFRHKQDSTLVAEQTTIYWFWWVFASYIWRPCPELVGIECNQE